MNKNPCQKKVTLQSNKTEENPLQNKRKLCKKNKSRPFAQKNAKNTNKTSCKKYVAKQDKKPCEQIQTTGNNQKRTPLQKEKTLQRKTRATCKKQNKRQHFEKIPKQNSLPKNPNHLQKQNASLKKKNMTPCKIKTKVAKQNKTKPLAKKFLKKKTKPLGKKPSPF